MLIMNYYYNNYQEVSVDSLGDGNDTSTLSVPVIVGVSVGGFFMLLCCIFIACVCCKSCKDEDDESDDDIDGATKTSII